MSNMPAQNVRTSEDSGGVPTAVVVAGVVLVVLAIVLIVGAVLLAANADTAGPTVTVVRDILIILLALELFVIGAALTVFIVQVARFVALMSNEIEPIIAGTQDTVRVVRGTAHFVSRHVSEPIIKAAAAVGGIAKVAKDTTTIRRNVRGNGAFSASVRGRAPARDEEPDY